MKQTLRHQLRAIEQRLDALDRANGREYLWADTVEERDRLAAEHPNATIISWVLDE